MLMYMFAAVIDGPMRRQRQHAVSAAVTYCSDKFCCYRSCAECVNAMKAGFTYIRSAILLIA